MRHECGVEEQHRGTPSAPIAAKSDRKPSSQPRLMTWPFVAAGSSFSLAMDLATIAQTAVLFISRAHSRAPRVACPALRA
jgi:hypothetical protein